MYVGGSFPWSWGGEKDHYFHFFNSQWLFAKVYLQLEIGDSVLSSLFHWVQYSATECCPAWVNAVLFCVLKLCELMSWRTKCEEGSGGRFKCDLVEQQSARELTLLQLGDGNRFWIFIFTLNRAKKWFHSIFYSKLNQEYSFKKLLIQIGKLEIFVGNYFCDHILRLPESPAHQPKFKT